jgi:hypothetical protein
MLAPFGISLREISFACLVYEFITGTFNTQFDIARDSVGLIIRTAGRRKQAMKMTYAPDVDRTLDALAHLICTDHTPSLNAVPSASISKFDGFEILGGYDDDDHEAFLLVSDPSDQPVWPVSVTTAIHLRGDEATELGFPAGTWMFNKFETLDKAKWRGRLQRASPRMFEHSVLWAQPDGKQSSEVTPLAIFGSRIVTASPANNLGRRSDVGDPVPAFFGHKWDDEGRLWGAKIVGGLMLRRRYMWSVLLGDGTGPRARFITDVVGVRQIFRLRDIPPGRLRRAALLHWVSEHWRKRRNLSSNDRTWVREHLRGSWSYAWNGLRCQIEPSVEDLEWLTAEMS